MSDKERLEELEDLFEDISKDMLPPYVGITLDTVVDVKWVVQYAKEQAERTEELVESCKRLNNDLFHERTEKDSLKWRVGELEGSVAMHKSVAYRNIEQNKRYRETLGDIRDISTGAVHEMAKKSLEGEE